MSPNDALLALIADLYSQIRQLTAENDLLRAELEKAAEREKPAGG